MIKSNVGASSVPVAITPQVVSFEAHEETSAQKQEWIDMENKEMEEELKNGAKADQLFDTKTGASIGSMFLSFPSFLFLFFKTL